MMKSSFPSWEKRRVSGGVGGMSAEGIMKQTRSRLGYLKYYYYHYYIGTARASLRRLNIGAEGEGMGQIHIYVSDDQALANTLFCVRESHALVIPVQANNSASDIQPSSRACCAMSIRKLSSCRGPRYKGPEQRASSSKHSCILQR